ncbi:MAG: GreA/GreB family elongation factor [Candidatus Magasanikbacteria bacterium]|nr:GreA/GreB family elongation factor [Candidatus Magasanikbacteria bacterium]
MQVPKRKSEQRNTFKADHFITRAKFDELQKQLEKFKKNIRPEAMKEVSRLAQTGDFSENHAYQMAKGRLRGINQRIFELEEDIKNAKIIEPSQNTNLVQIGHTVTLELENKTKTYQILGSTESKPTEGKISYLSPLGAELLGRQVGEIVTLKLADKRVDYKISKIE